MPSVTYRRRASRRAASLFHHRSTSRGYCTPAGEWVPLTIAEKAIQCGQGVLIGGLFVGFLSL